jgi:hypothetical protein
VLALSATAVGARGCRPAIAAEIRHGVCVVSGSLCTPAESRRAGLAPCPVHARSATERAGARVSIIRLDRDDALVIERRSTATVSISFVDGWRGGGEAGAGLSIPGGRGRLSAGPGRPSMTAGPMSSTTSVRHSGSSAGSRARRR